jgi:kinesin family protein 12
VTVFAYGQTGSGKSYTIMGRDDAINEQVLNNDQHTGLIPKAIKYIWSVVGGRNERYYIKVSFVEIYNESINDLLNPKNTNLQIRWNQKQGFFVEGLLVIDCKRPEDVVEIILEGHRNRKVGSHDLNKDSSRSHSILTVYIISEFVSDGQTFKKYGKISFVDLAGSERLKESHSQGEMIKETGNINKSLFVLGKVISALTDKKNSKQHIPYRDSKLTMLLMDSIGGTAKTLMIACVSPSQTYADETMSTLNYAARTMNIKNKPVVQVSFETFYNFQGRWIPKNKLLSR